MINCLFKNLGPLLGLLLGLLSFTGFTQDRPLAPAAPAAPQFSYNEKMIATEYSNVLKAGIAKEDIAAIDNYFKAAASVSARYMELICQDQKGCLYRVRGFADALHSGNQAIKTADQRNSTVYLEAFYHQLKFGFCSNCTAKLSRQEILLNAAEQVMNYVAANLMSVLMGENSKTPIDLNDFFVKAAKGNTQILMDEILKEREASIELISAEAKKGTLKTLNRILFSGFGMFTTENQDKRGFPVVLNTFDRPVDFQGFTRKMAVSGIRLPVMSAKTSNNRPTYSTEKNITYRWTFGEVFQDSNNNLYMTNGTFLFPDEIIQDTEYLARPGNDAWKHQIMALTDPCKFPAPGRNLPAHVKTEVIITQRCILTFQILNYDSSVFPHFALIGAEPLPRVQPGLPGVKPLPPQRVPPTVPSVPQGPQVPMQMPGPEKAPQRGIPVLPAPGDSQPLPPPRSLPNDNGPGFGPIKGGNGKDDLPPAAPKATIPKTNELPPVDNGVQPPPALPELPKGPVFPAPAPYVAPKENTPTVVPPGMTTPAPQPKPKNP